MFDKWNNLKKKIQEKCIMPYKQGEIYFMSIGKNIGYEVLGKDELFLRPVLVYKKLSKQTFIGILLSSKEKHGTYFFNFRYSKKTESTALLNQIRVFDIRRAEYCDGNISISDFGKLKGKLLTLLDITPNPKGKGSGYSSKNMKLPKSEIIISKKYLDVKPIPVNTPLLDGNEKNYLNECIDTGWISSEGPFVSRFEKEMAQYVGRKYATACSSGTAALDIAISALNLEKDDEVIMPTFTIISCCQALVKQGIKPVLLDSDLRTFNIKVEDIEAKITSKTKAIMIVHIFGLSVDIDPILDLAKKYDLKIIEDAAQMIGQEYKGKKCGSFGDISIFSFYPNKQITTGEGGMVLCDDENLDERAKSFRNLCFTSDRFIHHELGYNYRMTNIQAALGVAQLEQIDKIVEKKRWIAKEYNELLKDIECISLPIDETNYCKNIYWVYTIVLKDDFHKTSKEIMKELGSYKIGTRPFFYPMHRQPVFNNMGLFLDEELKNSEKLYEKGFYIPSGLALTKQDIRRVSEVLHKLLKVN